MFIHNPEADAALRGATELRSEGLLNDAIEQLIHFERLAAAGKVDYTVASFLRLPMYLQEAGRRDEAWEKFYKLLKHGYPNRSKIADIWLFERSTIYDKMRLFLQRDGNNLLAVHFGILSYAHSLSALRAQSRGQELEASQAPEKMAALVDRLLRKAKRTDLHGATLECLMAFIQRGYNLGFIEAESAKLFS